MWGREIGDAGKRGLGYGDVRLGSGKRKSGMWGREIGDAGQGGRGCGEVKCGTEFFVWKILGVWIYFEFIVACVYEIVPCNCLWQRYCHRT